MSQILHFLKHVAIKVGLFLRANWAYILWGAFHCFLAFFALKAYTGDSKAAIELTFLIYGISIGFAISPLGEFVMRSLERARPVETRQDKDYLMPLFDEVYQEAKAKTPSLNKRIKLYISEEKNINASAIGRKTVVITRGAMTNLSPEELKGVIAHELGHMASGDTTARLIVVVGNGFFSVVVLICKTMMIISEIIIALMSKRYILTLIVSFFVNLLFHYTVAAFLFLGNIILAMNSRYREFLADDYAYEINFGEELKDALYQINTLNMGGKRKLKEILKASHPHTTARIAKLERKLESGEE